MGNVAESVITNLTDLPKPPVLDTILQKGPSLANQALDTTKSLVEGVPLMGNVAQQNTTDVKQLWLLKKIVVRFLALLSIVSDFANENSFDYKLNDLAELIVVFVDDKFDKYAPSLAKKLVAKSQSLIYETKPLVKILVTTTQTLIIPPISTTIFLLQATKYFIQHITPNTKSAPLDDETTPLQKGLTTTPSVLQSSPLAATTQTLLQNSLDMTKSLGTNTILEKSPDLANQVQDATKSLVGGIPLVGNVAQSLVTNTTDVANQIVNTPSSLVNNNPITEVVSSASLETTKSVASEGSDSASQSKGKTKSLFGGIPLMGNVAESLVNTTNSLVNENPILEGVKSATQSRKKPQDTGTKAALQSAYTALKLAGIPVVAQLWYEIINENPSLGKVSEYILPVVESASKLYNKVVTYMDEKGYSISGYLPLIPIDEMKAAYKLVKTSREALTSEKIRRTIQTIVAFFYKAEIAFNVAKLESFKPELLGTTPKPPKKPAMGYVSEEMKKARTAIGAALGDECSDYMVVSSIIAKRWNYQIYHPLHATDS
ncbi:hypothetical protein E3N88_37398 [Mikania micrantha]|uniref:Uncharacterized protein n=1 Tax=Mikania micrantha TaxID=192012 RepID=A0A5N6LR38_9ASTR|nr:hypothetical protein E3N88_37398 [Mikania micrantha]